MKIDDIQFIIEHIDNPTEEIQLAAIQKNGYDVEFIDNPSEEVQLVAVQRNGLAIQHINNPSEKVQLAAVKQNENSILHITNPSENVQLAAVQQDGYVIKYIENPSVTVQIASYNIKFITIKDVLLALSGTYEVLTGIEDCIIASQIYRYFKNHTYYSVNELNVKLFETEEDVIFDKIKNLSSIHPIDDYYKLLEKKILIYEN